MYFYSFKSYVRNHLYHQVTMKCLTIGNEYSVLKLEDVIAKESCGYVQKDKAVHLTPALV